MFVRTAPNVPGAPVPTPPLRGRYRGAASDDHLTRHLALLTRYQQPANMSPKTEAGPPTRIAPSMTAKGRVGTQRARIRRSRRRRYRPGRRPPVGAKASEGASRRHSPPVVPSRYEVAHCQSICPISPGQRHQAGVPERRFAGRAERRPWRARLERANRRSAWLLANRVDHGGHADCSLPFRTGGVGRRHRASRRKRGRRR